MLTIGFSPCPNDTFIFDAMVNGKVDTEGLAFDVALEDVETLNQWALEGLLDITKLSYGVLPLVTCQYKPLDAGSALGRGVGPLLIARNEMDDPAAAIENMRVAIPGKHTTAHLLFSLAYPKVGEKRFMVFSEIEAAVLNGEVDAGVIIHENRFTYAAKGLKKIIDLGAYWEQTTGAAIPLGGIVTKNPELAPQLNRIIRRSLEYAFQHYPLLPDYVRSHAQEMEEEVMRQHINLYVNAWSLSLGSEGRAAIMQLTKIYAQTHQTLPLTEAEIFGSPA